ncbi:toll/interleukin-1 receptor domain-containing protein [Streptomyces nigra]|uniref:toll/interleukin-1 receptor domain-containing protein n=1 Tax=Streptomyces nigra TaxID=1827580 RepID=UPI003686D9C8
MANNGEPAGFWSYTHRDDEIEEGRVRRLARKIANEFEGITAEELNVFIDKQDVKWGDEWRKRIDSALTGSTFFMPIVTPRFFKSEECRREVLIFSGHAKSLGLEDLLLPILYFDVPQIRKPDPSDEVMALVAQRQYEDWTTLRLEDEDSPQYRQAVHRLAMRLVEILERTADVEPPPVALTDGEADEEPGMLELMAEAELALPRWAAVAEEFSKTIAEIGEVAHSASEEMQRSDARGGGFAGRLRITNKLAEDLSDPVDRLSLLGNQYSTELVNVDPGVLGIIRQIESGDVSSEEEGQIREFVETVKTTAQTSREAMGNIQGLAESIQVLPSLSKSLRPLSRKMQSALQQVMDGQAILDEWERRVDEVAGPAIHE